MVARLLDTIHDLYYCFFSQVDIILDVLTTLVVIWRYGFERNGNSKAPEMERKYV